MANRHETQRMLDLTCAMWDDPLVYFYQNSEFAGDGVRSVFLAGPSSRDDILEFKWRAFAVHYLREAGFQGIIYVPEPRENDWNFKDTFHGRIVEWESIRLLHASIAFVWVPRHQAQLPGRVTNTELGFLSGMAYAAPEKFKDRLVFGCPADAWKVNSEMHWTGLAGIRPFDDLQLMCKHVQTKLRD